MPNLARTPPQRVSPLPRSPRPEGSPSSAPTAEVIRQHSPLPAPAAPETSTTPRPSEGHTTISSTASPARAFAPRHPNVLRSPPSGSQLAQSQLGGAGTGNVNTRDVPDIEVEGPSASGIQVDQVQGDTTMDMEVDDPERTQVNDPDQTLEELPDDEEDFVQQQLSAGLSTAPGLAPTTPAQQTSTTPSTTPFLQQSSHSASTQSTTPLAPPPVHPTQGSTNTQPLAGPSSSIALAQSHSHIAQQATSTSIAQAVEPRTPRRRDPKHAEPELAPLEPLQVDEAAQFGKRYEITLDTLRVAIKSGAQKWTYKNLEQCFPLLCAERPETMRNVHAETTQILSDAIRAEAMQLLKEYRVGEGFQTLDEVVQEAKTHKEEDGTRRRDAWRPNLTPQAITAAANLGVYDGTFEKLRAEYLGLHADSASRLASIRAKQAELAAFESNVSDGVVELQKSIEMMNEFPTVEMKEWAETTMGRLEGGRGV